MKKRAPSNSARDITSNELQWKAGFVVGDYRWLDGDGMGGRNLDARTGFFYVATVNTPAMALKMVGKGSQYAFIAADKDGGHLDGAKTYRLNIPANVPAKDFWSVVIYDPQTRSELQTSQPFPSRNNKRDKLITNADGSVDLYSVPPRPSGRKRTGLRPCRRKGGSHSSACMARWSRGSRKRGSPERSNW